MKRHLFFIVLLIFLSGCSLFGSSNYREVDKANLIKKRLDVQLSQQVKELVTGTKEVLESISKAERSPKEQISLDLTVQAERVLGGEPIEKIDVDSELIEPFNSDKGKYNTFIKKRKDLITELKKKELNNDVKIEYLMEKAKPSPWDKIKNAFRNSMLLMIVAVIALLIFAPHVLAWIVSKIPSLVSLFGITSFRIVKNIVKGVQEVRSELAELPDGEKLDKDEILDLIDRGLKGESDEETANTVDTIREKYNLESITKKLRRTENVS